jgi:hypothetical protein
MTNSAQRIHSLSRLIPALGVALALGLAGCMGESVAVSSGPLEDPAGNPIPSFSQFPDIPIPAGSAMVLDESLIFGRDDKWTGRLVIETEVSASAAYEYFQREMPNQQWIELTALRSDVSLLSFSRMDRVATLTIESETLSGATVTITVSPLSPATTPAP